MSLRSSRAVMLTVLFFAVAPPASRAERLPSRTFTTANGLASMLVSRIVPDSRGFLWICTSDGLSRFDGYAMTTYTTRDGLTDARVQTLLETRAGDYWVATQGGGLCRLDARGERRFAAVPLGDAEGAKRVNDLLEAPDGSVLVATDAGLYRVADGGAAISRVDAAGDGPVTALCRSRDGYSWAGTVGGVRRLAPDGRVDAAPLPPALSGSLVTCVREDAGGTIWAGTRDGLSAVRLPASPSEPIALARVAEADRIGWIDAMTETSDGAFWVATTTGLWRRAASPGRAFERPAAFEGVSDIQAWDVAEDRDGSLWVATSRGAVRLERGGFTNYTKADGLASVRTNTVFESRSGDLVAIANEGGRRIQRLANGRFVAATARLPATGPTAAGWGWGQIAFQDRDDRWWLASGAGLLRYPAAVRAEDAYRSPPVAVTSGREAFRAFEDSRGDVWASLTGGPYLVRWDRATGRVVRIAVAPRDASCELTAFAETRDGAVWAGTSSGELLRWRGGDFERFGAEEGVPRGWVRALYVDDAGRLWLASGREGVARVDDPTAARPTFASLTMADGLTSDSTYSLVEDARGRIYVGTGRSVDRVDLETGRIKHFTSADGLPEGPIMSAFRDRDGRLWFGANFGLARLDPEPERVREPPRALLVGLRVAGVARPVSAVGEVVAPALDLGPTENVVSVDFLGLGTSLGEELRYQYRLDGSAADWSAPSAERTVTFASLAPGTYRFLVRAVDADGRTSLEPASVAFTVAAPLWRRWWALALAGLAVFGAATALFRYRLARLVEIERVRTHIATDLHDDLGANLTRIAILSEVASYRRGPDDDDASLASIARISRESVASMSDIVWAINPSRDTFRDFVRRMRELADEALATQGVRVRFEAPDAEGDARLGRDLRRHLYLVYKEAINNAARHSNCERIEIEVRLGRGSLTLSISDDGRGFDPSEAGDGNGLANMRRRAEAVGARLGVRSAPGAGTTVTLEAPLRGRQGRG